MTFNKHDYDSKQRFGIRKLSIGVCSVLLSTLFLTINEGQTVHADVQSDDGAHEETADSGAKKTGQPSQDLNVAEVLKQQKNPNYSFDVAKGVINYKITPAPATVTISNSASRDYTGQTTSVADVMDQVSWSSTGFVTGENLNHTDVTANDYTWYTKNADGTYTAMTGEPTNAGTYYLKLNDGAIAQIKRDNPNYSFADNAFTGEFTYTINAVTGTATLSGQNAKTYDGQEISLDDLNSTDGNIEVKFVFPGSTDADVYKLHVGDYIVVNNSADANKTYTVKLSDQGLANLQAALDKYAGNGNVTLNAGSLKGYASFKINPKDANVTLDGNDGSTYGEPVVINLTQGSFRTNGLVTGQSLNTSGLTTGDYEWVDA